MRIPILITSSLLVFNSLLSSKDKTVKVTYREMALGMRDAFNCGVIVEEFRNGRLKGQDDAYQKEKTNYNCAHVEDVLNSLNDQATSDDQAGKDQGGGPPQQ